MKDRKKISSPLRRDAPRAKATTPARARSKINVRVEPETYVKLILAAQNNHTSVSAEAARRLDASVTPIQTSPDPTLSEHGHDIMAAFKAGGEKLARVLELDKMPVDWREDPRESSAKRREIMRREIPPREWIDKPGCHAEAVCRAVEVLASRHPRPDFYACLLMSSAFNDALDQVWQRLLMTLPPDEARAEKEKAAKILEELENPAPSVRNLRNPLLRRPSKNSED